MPRIDWTSLITDPQGRIDYQRVGLLVATLLGLAGGVVLVLVLANLLTANDQLAVISGILVVPLTGGQIAAGLRGVAERQRARAVIAGAVPGRRAVDRPSAEEGA